MSKLKKRLLLLPGAYNSPAARFRIWQFANPLQELGYDVTIRVPFPDRENKDRYGNTVSTSSRIRSLLRVLTACWIIRDAHKFFAVIINRDIVPELRVTFLEERIIRKGGRLIFDFDDAIYLGSRKNKVQFILERVDAVVCGNKFLTGFARSYNSDVTVIPSVVDTNLYVPSEKRYNPLPIIGWIGSSHTRKAHLPLLQKPLELLAEKCDFEFRIIADEDPKLQWTNVKVKFIKWTEENEIYELQQLNMGLMPLFDSEFERGKCGFKAIQYMSVGIPALVSPVGINAEIVDHDKNGFHCSSTEDWVDSMLSLIHNNEKALQMGKEARDKIVNEYSMNKALSLWHEVLNVE